MNPPRDKPQLPAFLSMDEANALRAHVTDLTVERDRLREALGALGVIGDGYCFCSEHRDPHKERHEPECRQASAALQEGE